MNAVKDSHFLYRAWLNFALLTLSAALSLLFATTAIAAQQGTAGASSNGNVEITYVSGLNARLTGLADFNLGTASGTDLTANDNLCVGRTGVGFFGTGNFRINASGDGAPGDPAAFTLTDGTNRIYYDAYFNDATGTAGREQLTAGVTLTSQTGGGFGFILNYIFGCVTENANISVVVPAANLSSPAGVYTGTLSLLLIPD